MKHTIKYPDGRFGDELRTIIWDDEAGTVEGDHNMVPVLKLICEGNGVACISQPWGALVVDDVPHNPQHFLSILNDPYPRFEIDPRAVLPDSLKGIEPLVPPYEPPPPGSIY